MHVNIFSKLKDFFGPPPVKPEKNLLTQIKEHAEKGDSKEFVQALNDLCGPEGHAKIAPYKENYQVHLFFNSIEGRNKVEAQLKKQFHDLNFSNLSTNFDAWQLGNEGPLFSLKLSTNQSTALLGLNPQKEFDHKTGQYILKTVQETINKDRQASSNVIDQLPEELINKILLDMQKPRAEAGHWAQLSKHFSVVASNDRLWQNIADLQKTEISQEPRSTKEINATKTVLSTQKAPSTPATVKEQVKQAHTKYHNAVVGLKKDSRTNTIEKLSKQDILNRGGILLTENQSIDRFGYEGVAVFPEVTPKGQKWRLQFFTGDAKDFSQSFYDQEMPKAIQTLKDNKIVPDYYISTNNAALKNFQTWQSKQTKF